MAATKTLRVYVDGSPTAHATRVVSADDRDTPLVLHGLSPGTHTVQSTVQADGRAEGPRSAPRTVNVRPQYVSDPFAVEGATLAQTLSLRCLLRNRTSTSFGESFHAGPSYNNDLANNTYLNDYSYSMGSHTGYWTWQKVRAVVDAYAAHIGEFIDSITGQVVPAPPQVLRTDGSVHTWVSYGIGRFPDVSKAADLAHMVIYCHDLGDPTAWSTYRTVIETALDAFPRVNLNGGYLHYSDPNTDVFPDPDPEALGGRTSYYYWDEAIQLLGNVGTAAAEFCRTYMNMRRVALSLGDQASADLYQSRIDGYTKGLQTLRLTSGQYAGLYQPCSLQQIGTAHVPMTLLIAGYGFCTETERQETLAKLISLYEAHTLHYQNYHGYVRLLPYPQDWVQPLMSWPLYWSTTAMPSTLARCFDLGGRSDLATQWMQGAVTNLTREHRATGQAPKETVAAAAGGSGYQQSFSAGWVSDLQETLPAYVDLSLTGALGSSAERAFPNGHLIHGIEVIASGPSTVGVQVDGYALLGGLDSSGNLLPTTPPATYPSMGYVALAGQDSKRVDGVVPVGAYGGVVRARVTTGGSGALTVRLHMRPPGVPKIVATPTAVQFWVPPGYVADAGIATGYVGNELPADGVVRTVILRSCDGSEVSRATGAYFTVSYE